ncbi:MAG: nucleoside-diphosphate sugar epimerase/dehydratase [Evtepia sp.]
MRSLIHQKETRIISLVLLDAVSATLALYLSLVIRFRLEFSNIPQQYIDHVWGMLPYFIVFVLLSCYLFRIYTSLWAYASLGEAWMVMMACLLSTGLYAITATILKKPLPMSCYVMVFVLLTIAILSVRFGYRFARLAHAKWVNHCAERKDSITRVMIIGAGCAGRTLINEIQQSSHLIMKKVVCVLDDDPNKQNRYFCGIQVPGGHTYVMEAVARFQIDEIIFAIPSASMQVKKAFLETCKNTGCILKTVPGVYQLVNGEVSLATVRNVSIGDLLGREQVKLDSGAIHGQVQGKVILVTGAGGSIGSELCRQISNFEPKQLILFEINENTAYFLRNELKKEHPTLDVIVLIGSVRDVGRLDYVFANYKPEIVYHAAAHKHVPLMEDSPNEAVKNNVFGTLNLVRMSDRYQVERFVLISSDKAVNPTNIMGATKRICELIVQVYGKNSQTECVAVRFGNVLGSNGSVIPIFKRQIEEGGPVTVTDPEIIRYFMTIPEAVSLVLQAGIFAKGGDIFVLDMGEPVKILDLAKNMIQLSGFTPYIDIDIVFTGLRPGEKCYEELLMAEEGLTATEHTQIRVAHPLQIDETNFKQQLRRLEHAMWNEEDDIRPLVQEIVPTYVTNTALTIHPPKKVDVSFLRNTQWA